MASQKQRYTQEFRQEAARMVYEQKRSYADVTRELNISDSALRNWVAEFQPRTAQLSQDERTELCQLRKDVARLKMEQEILKKAAAFFAKELK
jgi:transposase